MLTQSKQLAHLIYIQVHTEEARSSELSSFASPKSPVSSCKIYIALEDIKTWKPNLMWEIKVCSLNNHYLHTKPDVILLSKEYVGTLEFNEVILL